MLQQVTTNKFYAHRNKLQVYRPRANSKHSPTYVLLGPDQCMFVTVHLQKCKIFSSFKVIRKYPLKPRLRLYLGLKVHAMTRSKTLLDNLFHRGMCILYNRGIQLQSDITNGICQRFEVEEA